MGCSVCPARDDAASNVRSAWLISDCAYAAHSRAYFRMMVSQNASDAKYVPRGSRSYRSTSSSPGSTMG